MFKFKQITLENGLNILLVPSSETLSVRALVLVKAGSLYESKDINGISHFMEHMCFKGTKKRPTSIEINKEIDEIGGRLNAFTSQEYTGYWAWVDKDHYDLALDVISDIYLNSIYPHPEMEKEKGVVIEELNMYHDDPKTYVWDLWSDVLYGDQPAGWEIGGTKKTIRQITRNKLLVYRQKFYHSHSTLVVISGNFSENKIKNLVRKNFKLVPKKSPRAQYVTIEKQNKPRVLLKYRETDQTHLILGWRAFDYFSPQRYALALLNAILDGGMSGILFQLVREQLGAAYYIITDVDLFKDHGYWAVATGLNHQKVKQVIPLILKEFYHLLDKHLTEKNLKKAKQYLIGSISLTLDNVHNYARDLAFDLLLKNEIETPEQYIKKIKTISLNDLKKTAQEIIKPNRLNLALVGPFKDKRVFEKLIKQVI